MKIEGNVADINATTRTKFKEFAFASGEMNPQEFVKFLNRSLGNMVNYSKDGSIHYPAPLRYGDDVFAWISGIQSPRSPCRRQRAERDGRIAGGGRGALFPAENVCVWNKGYGGMGLLYRSQHEMVFVFKKGEVPHTNNIELGKYGRHRTNVWNYPGMCKGKATFCAAKLRSRTLPRGDGWACTQR